MAKVKSKPVSKPVTIEDFLKAVNYNISGSAEYMWKCFGNNAQFLDWDSINPSTSAHIIFDTKTQRVFECEVWIKDTVYRWFNKGCRTKHHKEAQRRNISIMFAIDDLKYTEVENSVQILKILKDIVNPKKSKKRSRR